jgi:hypothetical protein
MGAGTVIFEGVRRKPKRNRGSQKARSIAENFAAALCVPIKNNMAILNIHRNHTAGVIYSR